MSVVARAPEILRHFLGEIIGSDGITLFGETYTADKLVQALGGALAGMIGLTAVERVAGLAVSLDLRHVSDARADALFHDFGAAPRGRGDLAAAARAPALGRGSAAEDRPGIAPLPDRPRSCRLLHRARGMDRLWPGVSSAPCGAAGLCGRRAGADPGHRPFRLGDHRRPRRDPTERHLGGSFSLRLRDRPAPVDRQSSSARWCSARRRGFTRSSSSCRLSAARSCSASSVCCSPCRWRYASRPPSSITMPNRSRRNSALKPPLPPPRLPRRVDGHPLRASATMVFRVSRSRAPGTMWLPMMKPGVP